MYLMIKRFTEITTVQQELKVDQKIIRTCGQRYRPRPSQCRFIRFYFRL